MPIKEHLLKDYNSFPWVLHVSNFIVFFNNVFNCNVMKSLSNNKIILTKESLNPDIYFHSFFLHNIFGEHKKIIKYDRSRSWGNTCIKFINFCKHRNALYNVLSASMLHYRASKHKASRLVIRNTYIYPFIFYLSN